MTQLTLKPDPIAWPVLAIDPGTTHSGVVVIDDDYTILEAYPEMANGEVLWRINDDQPRPVGTVVIEQISSYGMKVGFEVFETCVWTGRFIQESVNYGFPCDRIKRHDVKLHHCQTSKAKEPDITRALIERFAPDTPNRGKGAKNAPGWFYEVSTHAWAAYAAGVAWIDRQRGWDGAPPS